MFQCNEISRRNKRQSLVSSTFKIEEKGHDDSATSVRHVPMCSTAVKRDEETRSSHIGSGRRGVQRPTRTFHPACAPLKWEFGLEISCTCFQLKYRNAHHITPLDNARSTLWSYLTLRWSPLHGIHDMPTDWAIKVEPILSPRACMAPAIAMQQEKRGGHTVPVMNSKCGGPKQQT